MKQTGNYMPLDDGRVSPTKLVVFFARLCLDEATADLIAKLVDMPVNEEPVFLRVTGAYSSEDCVESIEGGGKAITFHSSIMSG